MRVGFFGATKLKRRPSGVFENVSNEAGSPIILTVELLMKIFFRKLEIIYSERETTFFQRSNPKRRGLNVIHVVQTWSMACIQVVDNNR